MYAEGPAREPASGSGGEPASEAYERWWRDDQGVLQVRIGPAWVFALWDALDESPVTCMARTPRGERCRHPVRERLDALTVQLSRYCSQHRPADEPVYRITAGYSDHLCPCGCGYRVLAYVMQATRLQPVRRRNPLLSLLGF